MLEHPRMGMQDPFDKQRIKALNDIKSEGKAWIAAHAKGGSAPGASNQQNYIDSTASASLPLALVSITLGCTTTCPLLQVKLPNVCTWPLTLCSDMWPVTVLHHCQSRR